MADFDELKDKNYPDSISEEDAQREKAEKQAEALRSSMMCVYAGPEYFRAKAEQAAKEQEENPDGKEPAQTNLYPDMTVMHRNPTPEEVNTRPQMMFVYAAPPLPTPGINGFMQVEPKQAPAPKFCHECGYPLDASYKFCPMCGTKILRPENGGMMNC